MTTAIIGVGHLGSALAQHLVRGSEPVVLAAEDQSHARQVATALGPLAMAVPVREAISQADTVVLAVWLDSLKEVVAEHSDLLNGKVIVDPTNPLGFDENGNFLRTLPEHQSSASVVAALLPPRAHDVKAFGTLSATSLASSDNRSPRRADLLADRALRVEEAGANIRLLSGTVEGIAAPAQTETPVQYLDLRLNAGARIDLPVPASHNGFVLVVEGEVKVGAERVHSGQGQVLWLDYPLAARGDARVDSLRIEAEAPARVLAVSGEPIGERVVAYGPFVMNSEGGNSPGVSGLSPRTVRRPDACRPPPHTTISALAQCVSIVPVLSGRC